jgi:hypothetical protein
MRDSFGVGDDVTWNRPDMKVFLFNVVSATRAVVILHYQAKDISEGEVIVTLNGVEVGSVPADTTDFEHEIELEMPPKVIKRDAPNQVMFDNVRNPPGNEPWRVMNLWIESIPIPELPEDQLLALAADYAKKAKESYERKDVGAENLYKAWKNYRNAWATLEGMGKKPELHEIARTEMLAMKKELDQQCARLMLEAKRQMELKKRKKARVTLDEVSRYFPTGEHRCHNLALEKIQEYEL